MAPSLASSVATMPKIPTAMSSCTFVAYSTGAFWRGAGSENFSVHFSWKPVTSLQAKAQLTQPDNDENRLFLHLEYHPDDISCSRIQKLYQQHLGEVLLDELGILRPTIAYHRPKNIGDFVSRAKLIQASGQETSTIMGEVRAELASL